MKAKYIILLSLIILTRLSFSQSNGIIIDKTTKKPVPYVNIWIENENYGTTSNFNGIFELDKSKSIGKTLVFSSVSYKTKKIRYEAVIDTIMLEPDIINIPEVIISTKKKLETASLGFLKRKIPAYYNSCNAKPLIIAKKILFNHNYENTPFLKSIEFLTQSNIKNAKFKIRLHSIDENGFIGNRIYSKNIIGIARKGTHKTKIDISDLDIIVPKEGFFILIEWLIIDDNKHTFSYVDHDSRKKYYDGISYEPSFATYVGQTNEISWIYRSGYWDKNSEHINSKSKPVPNQYDIIQTKITLSN